MYGGAYSRRTKWTTPIGAPRSGDVCSGAAFVADVPGDLHDDQPQPNGVDLTFGAVYEQVSPGRIDRDGNASATGHHWSRTTTASTPSIRAATSSSTVNASSFPTTTSVSSSRGRRCCKLLYARHRRLGRRLRGPRRGPPRSPPRGRTGARGAHRAVRPRRRRPRRYIRRLVPGREPRLTPAVPVPVPAPVSAPVPVSPRRRAVRDSRRKN